MKNLLLNDPLLANPLPDFSVIAPRRCSVEITNNGLSFCYDVGLNFYCSVNLNTNGRNSFAWYLPSSMCNVLAFEHEGFFVMNFEEDFNHLCPITPLQSALDHIGIDIHDIEVFKDANRILLKVGYEIWRTHNG